MKSKFLLVAICLLFVKIGKGQVSSGSITLSPSDITNSQQFKSLSGLDRYAVCLSLDSVILTSAKQVYANSSTPVVLTNYSEILQILGNPDFQLTAEIFGYYLRGNGGSCQAVFCKATDDKIQYFSIIDCN